MWEFHILNLYAFFYMGKCTSLVVIDGLHNKKLIFRTEDYK